MMPPRSRRGHQAVERIDLAHEMALPIRRWPDAGQWRDGRKPMRDQRRRVPMRAGPAAAHSRVAAANHENVESRIIMVSTDGAL